MSNQHNKANHRLLKYYDFCIRTYLKADLCNLNNIIEFERESATLIESLNSAGGREKGTEGFMM